MKTVKIFVLALFAAAIVLHIGSRLTVESQALLAEAPAGFDNVTNGFVDQATFDQDMDTYKEQETIAQGLGPCYNSQSCGECHQTPVAGGISQITELRAGHYDGSSCKDHPGGSLINDRATDASLQEQVRTCKEVRTLRRSCNTHV